MFLLYVSLVGVKIPGHIDSGLCSKLLAVYSCNYHSRSIAVFSLVFLAHITACQKARGTR